MSKVSFCGISGSGMSALAQVLLARGDEVCGSDRSFDQGKDASNRQALQQAGIKIFPQDGSAVSADTECLYVSTTIEDRIPDVKKALSLNVPVKKRSDLLAEILNQYPYTIAVGGTSGKTTLTAMIGYILDQLGHKPTIINGGLMKNYHNRSGIPNVIVNNGDICVAEADESDGSIEKYNPYISVINNITLDHKSIAELQTLFLNFAKRAKAGAVINLDCKNSEIFATKDIKTVSFSIVNPHADVYLHDIKPLINGTEFQLENQTFQIQLPGAFNVANAAAAIAACRLMGINSMQAAKALENFLGTQRRLDIIGTKNGITVIDDFAHNPDKVSASLSALRSYPGRLLIMFQPHGFSPMRMMGRQIIESFAANMLQNDYLLMPEIYYTGGTVTRDISSLDLIQYAQSKGVAAEFYQTRAETQKRLLELAQPGDRIVVMGARDNSLPGFCQEILEGL